MTPTVDALITSADSGDRKAANALFSALYDELHRLAQRQLASQGAPANLGATTLLHEAYLAICDRSGASFPDRARFMAYAARVMRGLIIDDIRERLAQKRGGGQHHTTFATDVMQQVAGPQSLERISDAQGRREPPVAPGLLVHTVRSPRAGVITEIDGWAVAGIARRAGAPFDKAAGIDLRRHVGDAVAVGDPLFAIHASASSDLDVAKAIAESCDCYVIG